MAQRGKAEESRKAVIDKCLPYLGGLPHNEPPDVADIVRIDEDEHGEDPEVDINDLIPRLAHMKCATTILDPAEANIPDQGPVPSQPEMEDEEEEDGLIEGGLPPGQPATPERDMASQRGRWLEDEGPGILDEGNRENFPPPQRDNGPVFRGGPGTADADYGGEAWVPGLDGNTGAGVPSYHQADYTRAPPPFLETDTGLRDQSVANSATGLTLPSVSQQDKTRSIFRAPKWIGRLATGLGWKNSEAGTEARSSEQASAGASKRSRGSLEEEEDSSRPPESRPRTRSWSRLAKPVTVTAAVKRTSEQITPIRPPRGPSIPGQSEAQLEVSPARMEEGAEHRAFPLQSGASTPRGEGEDMDGVMQDSPRGSDMEEQDSPGRDVPLLP